MTSAGKWTDRYRDLEVRYRYGDETTYRIAAAWMGPCAMVEDWGSGGGFLGNFIPPERYVAVDGSPSPFTHLVADLTEYRSEGVDGIVLRHVLEHEHEWAKILDNAIASFRLRLFIAIFTPFRETTRVLGIEHRYNDVPTIAFSLGDLAERIPEDVAWTVETIEAPGTFFGQETMLRLER